RLFTEASALSATDRTLFAQIAEAAARLPPAPPAPPPAAAPAPRTSNRPPAIRAMIAPPVARLSGSSSAQASPAPVPTEARRLPLPDAAPESRPPRSLVPLDDSPLVRELLAG